MTVLSAARRAVGPLGSVGGEASGLPTHGVFDGADAIPGADMKHQEACELVFVEIGEPDKEVGDAVRLLARVRRRHHVNRLAHRVRLVDMSLYEFPVDRQLPGIALATSANRVATTRVQKGRCDHGAGFFSKRAVVVPYQAGEEQPFERQYQIARLSDGHCVVPSFLYLQE